MVWNISCGAGVKKKFQPQVVNMKISSIKHSYRSPGKFTRAVSSKEDLLPANLRY